MTYYLPSLLKRINNFYLQSIAQAETYVSPDDEEDEIETPDPELGWYPNLINASQKIMDPSIAEEVHLIAELYKRTLELNQGFNFVYKAISNFINLIDEDDEGEQRSVENLLNEVSKDLRNRMKVAGTLGKEDSPSILQALKQTKDTFDRQTIEEETSGTGYGGGEAVYESGEEGSGLTEYEETAKETFDLTGGVGGEVAAKKGRGYHFQTKSFKDWIKSYQSEQERLEHDKKDPNLYLARTGVEARHNASVRSNIDEMINNLKLMQDQTKQAIELENQLALAPDESTENKLTELRVSIKDLQQRRTQLKTSLRGHHIEQKTQELENEFKEARSNTDKFLLQQKIELQQLMKSPDKGKGEELKLRRQLINAMSGGNALGEQTKISLMQKIQEAADKKTKSNKLYRQKAEQVAQQKGTTSVIKTRDELLEGGTRAPRKGLGHGVIHDYKLDQVALEGLITHLTQRLATERVVVKQKVTDKMKKAQQDPAQLKPYMDDVAKAATKKDKTALITAVKRMKQKMIDFKNVQPELIQYVISLRSSKFFYGFRDKINTIYNWLKTPAEITDIQISFINDTIKDGEKLIEFYKGLKISPITPGWTERSTHYKPPTEIIFNIVNNLKQTVGQ